MTWSYNIVNDIRSKLSQYPTKLAQFEANDAKTPHPERVQGSIGVGLTHLHVLAAEEAPAVAAGSRHDLDRVLQVSEPPCTVL